MDHTLLQVPCEAGDGIHAAYSEFGALHMLEHAPRSSPGTALRRLARQDDKIVVRCGSLQSIVLVRLGHIVLCEACCTCEIHLLCR